MTTTFVIARMSRRDDEAISGCRFDDVLCWLGMMRLLPCRTLGDCFATLAMTKWGMRLLPCRTLRSRFARN